jgi:hypothetical protein
MAIKELKDKKGTCKTDALFLERITKNQRDLGVQPFWTLREYDRVIDGKTYPSFYQLYMECADDYDAGMTLLGSSTHWAKLKKIKWFSEGWKACLAHRGYDTWAADMHLRDVSLARKTLLEAAKKGNASAANQLAGLLKLEANLNSKGRPKDEDIARAALDVVEEDSAFAEDIKRLNVIKIR